MFKEKYRIILEILAYQYDEIEERSNIVLETLKKNFETIKSYALNKEEHDQVIMNHVYAYRDQVQIPLVMEYLSLIELKNSNEYIEQIKILDEYSEEEWQEVVKSGLFIGYGFDKTQTSHIINEHIDEQNFTTNTKDVMITFLAQKKAFLYFKSLLNDTNSSEEPVKENHQNSITVKWNGSQRQLVSIFMQMRDNYNSKNQPYLECTRKELINFLFANFPNTNKMTLEDIISHRKHPKKDKIDIENHLN